MYRSILPSNVTPTLYKTVIFLIIFRLHDFDNNTMLDGLEIFKALTHLVPFDGEGKDKKNPTEAEKEEQLKYYTGQDKKNPTEAEKEEQLKYYTGLLYILWNLSFSWKYV